MQAIQKYIHQEVPLVHTQTWQLCECPDLSCYPTLANIFRMNIFIII